MLSTLVRPRIEAVFAALAAGDTGVVLAGVTDDVEHRFAGTSALGGERHGRAAFARWLGRLGRLCPSLDFTVHDVLAAGPPWRLRFAVEWTALVTPAAGPAYVNHGTHLLRMRGARVASLHAYEDAEAVAEACRVMVDAGVTEAGAPPLT